MGPTEFIRARTMIGGLGIGSSTVVPSDTGLPVNPGDPITPQAPFVHPTSGEPRVSFGLAVLAAGTVKFVGADGVVDTWTVPSGASFPASIPVGVQGVYLTGTTVGAGNIKAIW